MKKLFALLMVLLMLASVCGCGSSDVGGNDGTNDGTDVGTNDGANVGTNDGTNNGTNNGTDVGANDGTNDDEMNQVNLPEPGTPLSTFYQAVLDMQPEDAEELIFFEEFSSDLIASFYPGLENIELNQQAFYMPPIATHPCEIVLVEVKNSEDVQKVVEIFRARIDLGASDTSYLESAAGWQQYAQVQQSGNFVCMIVLPEGYIIPENVFAA